MTWKLTAFVKDSPNTVPIATMTTRSVVLADATADLWRRNGLDVVREQQL